MASSLLPLFKEQLEAECASIAQRLGLDTRGKPLIYWYFTKLHDFSETDVEGVICDGAGDLGIDAIWFDDESSLVHFYQFKNPVDPSKGIPGGDVDKVISGLGLILRKQYQPVANPELQARLEEIYQQVPNGYRLHFVSSGEGIPHESQLKLDNFASALNGPTGSLFEWDDLPLARLQERFYQHTLPAVKEPLRFNMPQMPYILRSGVADCYMFSLGGGILADLYKAHGEGLLQRNIRVDQRDTATNRSIEATCTGTASANFVHFNNGVTFLCESASYDGFLRILSLEKAQVVNGGQTIRALYRASQKGSLRVDVQVPARAITSSGDKVFANDVAVNQNNQNQVGTGFLRSNDPAVIQLDHALASLGWFLERREGELKNATEEERLAQQRRISRSLDEHVIHLKEGAQAYVATFYGQPELAKKNVKRIFLSVDDGGHYERVFSAEMTAEKMVVAHKLKTFVDEFVKKFATIRRKVQASNNIKVAYESVLGKELTDRHSDVIHQVMPQCSLFLCGTIFRDFVDNQRMEPSRIPDALAKSGDGMIRMHLLHTIDYAKNNKDKADKSWPVLLKSQAFFNYITAYIAGIRRGSSGITSPSTKGSAPAKRKTRNP